MPFQCAIDYGNIRRPAFWIILNWWYIPLSHPIFYLPQIFHNPMLTSHTQRLITQMQETVYIKTQNSYEPKCRPESQIAPHKKMVGHIIGFLVVSIVMSSLFPYAWWMPIPIIVTLAILIHRSFFSISIWFKI